MRVTLVGSINPGVTLASGVRAYVLALARELNRLGQDVRVLGVGPSTVPSEDFEFVPITDRAVSSAEFVLALGRYLRRAEPLDGVVHGGRPDDLVPFHVEAKHVPTVLTLHGVHGIHVRAKRGPIVAAAYRLAEGYSLARTDAILCVSPDTLAHFQARYPSLSDRMRMIPAGVNMDLFRDRPREEARREAGLTPSGRHLVFVGRFEPEKNPIRIADEFARLRRGHPDAKLLMVGNGRLGGTLRAMAAASDGGISVLPPLPQERLAAVLAACEALVVASRHEGLPTIALEALACGTPVVGTRVGILPDIIRHGTNGFLADDPADLFALMEKALYGTSWVGKACRDSVRDFGWDRIAPRILEVYREVAA